MFKRGKLAYLEGDERSEILAHHDWFVAAVAAVVGSRDPLGRIFFCRFDEWQNAITAIMEEASASFYVIQEQGGDIDWYDEVDAVAEGLIDG